MAEQLTVRLPSRAGRERLARLLAFARRETTLAPVGLALISLHVLDDSFLQPQPGTSAADHLISGLVPLAVLVLAAAFYSRLRPGLRASILAILGLFGVVTGIEAVYYLDAGRLSGDDYTGLAAIPAGLLLICVAATTLWRARRSDRSLFRRWLRRVLVASAAFVVTYMIVLPFLVS